MIIKSRYILQPIFLSVYLKELFLIKTSCQSQSHHAMEFFDGHFQCIPKQKLFQHSFTVMNNSLSYPGMVYYEYENYRKFIKSVFTFDQHFVGSFEISCRDGNSCRLSDFAGSILELPEGFWDFFTKISDSVMQKIEKMS